MKDKIKKILFPFQKTYFLLNKYLLHRLFVVLFFAIVVITPISIFFIEQNSLDRYSTCLYTSSVEFCEIFAPYDPYNFIIANLFESLVLFIFLFYIFQIIYFFMYKIVKYIIGNKNVNK